MIGREGRKGNKRGEKESPRRREQHGQRGVVWAGTQGGEYLEGRPWGWGV